MCAQRGTVSLLSDRTLSGAQRAELSRGVPQGEGRGHRLAQHQAVVGGELGEKGSQARQETVNVLFNDRLYKKPTPTSEGV